MDTDAPPIAKLPPELLCLIVQALDPISLISLSQTNKPLRFFISPRHIHFVHRLLALELLPEHGGIVPLFNARLNTFRPPPHDASWNQNKYACSGCLKLLTHKMFDNHSIHGLGLRKPPPASEEAMKLTNWEPPRDQEAGWWKRWQRQQDDEQEKLRSFRVQYATVTRSLGEAVNGPQPPNGFLLTGSDDVQDDTLAKEAESVLCGRSRHRRLCLECKRKQGVFARRTRSNIGAPEAPTIVSRQVPVPDILSFCFPRHIHGVPEPPLPRILRVNHPDCSIYLRSAVVIFCPQCSTWQDMWAFGPDVMPIIDLYSSLWNRNLDDPQKSGYKSHMCYHCILSTKGMDRFRDSLLHLFMELAETSAHQIRWRLNFGWSQFWREFYGHPVALNKPRYQSAGRRIFGWLSSDDEDRDAHCRRFMGLCTTAHGSAGSKRGPNYSAKSAKDAVLELSQSIRELRRFLYTEATLSDQLAATESWQGIFLEDYEDNEQALFYLYYIMASVKNDPQRLVDYVLHPDRFRYPRRPLSSFQQDILAREEQGDAGRRAQIPYRKPSRKDKENELAWNDMYFAARDRAQAQKKNAGPPRATRS